MPPPTDPVFTTATPANGASPNPAPAQGTPTPTSTGQAAQVASPAAPDISAQINAAIAPLAQSVAATEKFMRETSEYLQSQGNRSTTPPPSDDEWMNGFYVRPKEQVAQTVSEVAAPIVGAVANSQATLQMNTFQSEIDRDWGPGAWDKVIGTPMKDIVKRAVSQNPASVLNEDAMRSTLNSLVGANVKALAEYQKTVQSSLGESEAKDFDAKMQASLQRSGYDQSTLSGGIRRTAVVSDKLPDDTHEYLAGQLRDAGRVVDEKRAALAMARPIDSYEDWKKFNAEAEGKKS